MSTVWYTADLHIGHKFVSGLRGFFHEDERPQEFGLPIAQIPDTEAHDAWLDEIWDRTVSEGDQVFILGDISINGGQHALDWIEARPGIKHLISGNHDPVGPWHRKSSKLLPHWLEYFETIQPYYRRRLNGKNFLMSHFPYMSFGDGEEREGARYEQYRLPDLGLPLLHGHTHGVEKAHDNMLHVGVDAWKGQLVSQETILDWLETVS